MRQRTHPLVTSAAVVGVAVLALPLAALLVRAPWGSITTLVASREVLTTLRLSLWCAGIAAAVSTVLGVPLAWLLATAHGRWAEALRVLVTLPLVLPPVVGGVALLLAFGRNGLFGHWMDAWFGVSLPFTTAAVVLSEVFVAMPFLVVTVEGAFRQRDIALEEAAQTMGAGRWQVLRHVTFPLAAPSIGAGIVLSWARALGEFGATITFAGNYPGRTRTMPLAVYLAMQTDPAAAVGLSVVLLAVSAAVLVFLRGRWWSAALRRRPAQVG